MKFQKSPPYGQCYNFYKLCVSMFPDECDDEDKEDIGEDPAATDILDEEPADGRSGWLGHNDPLHCVGHQKYQALQ